MKKSLNGFIKLHRSILDWEWYDDTNTKIVFLHLLLIANFKDTLWHGLELKRGDVVTSIASLSNDLGLSPRQIRTALSHLESTGEVTSTLHPKFRIVTIINYDLYLEDGNVATSKRQADDKQATSKRQQRNNDKNDNKYNKPRKGADAHERQSSFDVDDLYGLSRFD